MSRDGLLRCEGLGASYDGREVFRSVDFAFAAGVHALHGPNGTGKSTLLRVLAGAQPASAGRVWIDGIDLMQAPEEAKHWLSYVPDVSPVYPFMTGAELMDFVCVVKRTALGGEVERMILAFGLTPHLHTRFDAMSLGTQKKFLLCAAWIGGPRVLLLDEPSNGLDAASRQHLIALLQECGRDHVILFSTHDEEFVAACATDVTSMQTLLGGNTHGGDKLPAAVAE